MQARTASLSRRLLRNRTAARRAFADAAHSDLLDGQQFDAASLLLACQLHLVAVERIADFDIFGYLVRAELAGTRDAVTVFNDARHAITIAVKEALSASVPADYSIQWVSAHVEMRDLDPDWRQRLAEIANGKAVNNQGASHGGVPGAPLVWQGLRFRSQSEVRVAQALDAAGALYLPNCLTRLNVGSDRQTREADFLVCEDGRWGVLEVDGPHHEGKAADDHDRDRLFRTYGIKVVERFPSLDCFNNATDVVQRFLGLLRKNG